MPFFSRLGRLRAAFHTPDTSESLEAHVAAEPPTLQLNGLNGLFQTNMNLSGFGTFTLDPVPTSPHQNGVPTDGASSPPHNSSPANSTPSRPTFAQSRRFHSQPVFDANGVEPESPVPTAFGTPRSDQNDLPWSSAVGRATTGKSGRVIERLMAENDRLRRENNLLEVKWEEEVKRSDSAKSTMEELRAANEHLRSSWEIDMALLSRKDRKLREINTDLETERQRREKAENDTRQTHQERDEAVEGLKKELHIATEQAKRANIQYDVVAKSYRSLEDNYGRQTRKLKADMQSLREEITEDQRKLMTIQTIMEHHQSESRRVQDAKERMKQTFDAYRDETERELISIREAARETAAANERKEQEMLRTVEEMRYVINVKRNVRGLE
ncbi:MAG: hypothetical protein LQ352_000609 [Teloschistes flavicans]|nr:MAG: hypothetical protein LQ352_000609 [Teloschistes flavicans]